MPLPSLTLVVQRYGPEVNGGAETFARMLAERLTAIADVRVLTTCAIDYHTWANAYEPGVSELNGVMVERHPVDFERADDMAERTSAVLHKSHTLFDEYDWMRAQGPYSTGLFNAIRDRYPRTDLFIFVTYLYAHTVFGLPLVADKAVLIPHAHDEPFLRLGIMRPLFHAPQAIVYNIEPEMALVQATMQNSYIPQFAAGVGIDAPQDVDAARFRAKFGIAEPFLLYVGRIDVGKNVNELFDHFARYKATHGGDLKLVLIGKAHIPIPQREDVVALGFVSESDKYDALASAEALVQPSKYESLSLVAMEAWLVETPVIVNGHSEVLKYQCRQSNGGFYTYSYEEFELAVERLLADPALGKTLGRQGKRYVQARFDWRVILAKFQALIDTLTQQQD